MAAARERQKENIVKKQVVMKKEFKGQAFISKPDKILFKDFQVGKTYVQTILLTNVSLSFNSFKLLPMDDSIRDYFEIKYTPSGRMSAGLSTTIQISFTPKLKKDIDINSYLPILAETGQINIPLVCTCRKALLDVDTPIVDFGRVIYGEKSTVKVKLSNSGALPVTIYTRTNEKREFPVLSKEEMDEMWEENKKEKIKEWIMDRRKEEIERKRLEEEAKKAEEPVEEEPPAKKPPPKKGKQAVEEEEEEKEPDPLELPLEQTEIEAAEAALEFPINEFHEFCVQTSFSRVTQLDGYSSKNLNFTFTPLKMGKIFQEGTLYFDNQDYTDPIPIVIKGECIDVPVYVEKLTYDLNILVYEKTFRESIILYNRSPHTMKLQLYFPSELKPYLEFNPTLGYIQGNDKFEIWMKFKADRTILTNCKKYITYGKEDSEDYSVPQIDIPIKVVGASQVLPIKFNIVAKFTVDSITFNPPTLQFGSIWNQGASRVNFNIENHSLLPQRFYFVNLPKEIRAETDDGCGVVLPGEKYPLSIAYRPSVENAFEEGHVACRIITGDNICSREMKIKYQVNISKCPIKVDKTQVKFQALPEKEKAEVVFQFQNLTNKCFMMEVAPPPLRLSGLMVTPLVIEMKEKGVNLVSVTYMSDFRHFTATSFDEYKIEEEETKKKEMMRGIKEAEEKKAEEDEGENEEDAELGDHDINQTFLAKKKKRRRNKRLIARFEKQEEEEADDKAKGKAPPKKEDKKEKAKKETEEEIAERERLEQEAKEQAERDRIAALEDAFDQKTELRKLGGELLEFNMDQDRMQSQHYTWQMPVFFREKDKVGKEESMQRIYLEVRTTTVQRALVPNIEKLDFGEIPVAFRKTKEVMITNIGEHVEELQMEALTPYGGFSVLNARRAIAPGETKPILIEFKPFAQQVYDENLLMYSSHTVASVKLSGRGVRPEVRIKPEDGLMYFANVLMGETAEREFEIENVSGFPVKFDLKHRVGGITNKKGLSCFTYIPQEGTVPANSTLKVKIIFCPDRPSEDYFQIMHLDVPNQINEKKIYVRGFSYTKQTFARAEDPFKWREIDYFRKQRYEEPLLLKEPKKSDEKKRIVLEFSRMDVSPENLSDEEREKQTVRKLLLGNCKLEDSKMEKNANYELTPPGDNQYFSCDIPKGALNSGQEFVAEIKFTPPELDPLLSGIDSLRGIGQWVESIWALKLQGGYVEPGLSDVEEIDVVLRAYVEQI